MSDSIYHDRVMELAKSATGSGLKDPSGAEATIDNPLCGDRITLQIDMEGNRIAAVRHKVRGCALCEASAALIAGNATGLDRPALTTARQNIEAIVRHGEDITPVWEDMSAFSPVHHRKSRQDCVLLPFDALDAALQNLE
ncbi:MAG: iron-sulfur cluster assembly scaffold protein [Rhodospirillales bacterium]